MAQIGYRNLKVWQVSVDMVEQVYQVTKSFPKSEVFGLVSQMRRAAVSIPSNIAEGAGRRGTKEYLNHLSIARGSLFELETQLTIAVRLGLMNRNDALPIWASLQSIGRMLTKLNSALQKRLPKPNTKRQTPNTDEGSADGTSK